MEDFVSRWLEDVNNEILLIGKNSFSLGHLKPMTYFNKSYITDIPNTYRFFSLEDKGIYSILGEEEVTFYIECKGQQDLNWILGDIRWKTQIKEGKFTFTLMIDKLSATFKLNLIHSIQAFYSLRLLQQKEFTIFYLLDKGEEYCYLGYQKVDFGEETRNDIKNSVTKNIRKQIARAFPTV